VRAFYMYLGAGHSRIEERKCEGGGCMHLGGGFERTYLSNIYISGPLLSPHHPQRSY
jgi:hypothetical protein